MQASALDECDGCKEWLLYIQIFVSIFFQLMDGPAIYFKSPLNSLWNFMRNFALHVSHALASSIILEVDRIRTRTVLTLTYEYHLSCLLWDVSTHITFR